MFLKLQCQHRKIIGGAGFVYCVCLKVAVLTLAPGWAVVAAGFNLDHLWTLVFTETTSAQCPRTREESRREHLQKQAFFSFSFPQLKHTHRVLTTHVRATAVADTRTARLSPLPQWIFHLPEASDTSKPARLHIWAIMWSSDGKIITPPRTLMLLLTCYYAVIKSENAIWCWRHFED